jgi:prevent-host-death family protein
MIKVNVTKLRANLPNYLGMVRKGEEIAVTSRGNVIARILPDRGGSQASRERLAALRGKCRIGDVITPLGETWESAQ